MATSPSKPLFLESVSTGQQSHNAEWIASNIERIVASYPKRTFAGAVTDNTSANKNAWVQLAQKHPSAYFQGCTSHRLHLLVKDIYFLLQKQRKEGMLLELHIQLAILFKNFLSLLEHARISQSCFIIVTFLRFSCRLNRR
jgi:Protein of unknown function (DUF 659)